MKFSSISTGNLDSKRNSLPQHLPLMARLRQGLRAFSASMGRLNVAIVLSEAGDLEGAKALLKKSAE